MKYKNIIITGGAGFVGSNLASKIKENYPSVNLTVFDNLSRRGSELSLSRLEDKNISFIHGDIRNLEDVNKILPFDLMIDCSANPAIMAGINNPNDTIQTNLVGTINCLEACRRHNSHLIFLSTSRVYSLKDLNQISYHENKTRFEINQKQDISGISVNGINENFPTGKYRSMYGTTKLTSELLIQEYLHSFKIKAVINRCGIIAGPWQMGKIDQGIITLWLARHFFKNKNLSYIGFGGQGKQVRDIIDIDDLYQVIDIQINNLSKYNDQVFNIGGGYKNSLSLFELTKLCQKITGNSISISNTIENRPDDIPIYISDNSKFSKISGWLPSKSKEETLEDIYSWIKNNKTILKNILT